MVGAVIPWSRRAWLHLYCVMAPTAANTIIRLRIGSSRNVWPKRSIGSAEFLGMFGAIGIAPLRGRILELERTCHS